MNNTCAQHPTAPVIGGICGGCTQYPENSIQPAAMTTQVTPDFTQLVTTLRNVSRYLPPPPHPDTERRNAYAAALREEIKGRTFASVVPGGLSSIGATEYDLADVALRLADIELAQLRAERDAALRLADVWDDAPDPLVRHSAGDLRSAIRGARPARHLDCGLCHEENGEEVHPHPECPTGRTATEATGPRKCPPGVHSLFDPCPGNCTLPDGDDSTTAPDALAAAITEAWNEVMVEQRAATTCGATSEGIFDEHPLGPCIKEPHPEAEYHRDTRGREWQLLITPAHRTELARRLAQAIHRYDYEHGLTGNDIPGSHCRGETNAVLTALEEFLTIGDAEAWCKSCRRVWEDRSHRCESTAEQQLATLQQEHAQLGARVEQLMRTLHALRRFNQLTAEGVRVQAAEHARDNLTLLDSILGPLTTTPEGPH
ncbi:hypothetical protein ACFVY4_26975 [Streptomyces sp. NPDC058299]|uniref:hypothetical protein n=1 Tax=Streptomyces sp. NPDC058299 TaxID=3346435 RepID=UPI0036EEF2B1